MDITNYIISKNQTKRRYILNADVDAEPDLLPELARRGCRNLYGFGEGEGVYSRPLYTKIKYEVNDKRNCHFPDRFFDIIIDGSSSADKPLGEYGRLLETGGIILIRSKGRWVVRRGRPKPTPKLPKELNIVVTTKGNAEGIRYTTDIMKARLEEQGIKVNLCRSMREARRGIPTILEWMPYMRLPKRRRVIVEAHDLPTLNNIGFSIFRIFSDARYWVYAPIYAWKFITFQKRNIEARKLMKRHLFLARTYTLARKAGIPGYYLMPHCLPATQEAIENLQAAQNPSRPLCLGAYGFAAWYKNFDATCRIARRLDVRLILLMSINYNNDLSIRETWGNALKLRKRYASEKITIKIGEWSNEQIRKELEPATHIISTQVSVDNISSSIRFAQSLGKPIIAPDTYQAREAQAIRAASPEAITRSFLETTRRDTIYMDDGTRYILKILGCIDWKKYC